MPPLNSPRRPFGNIAARPPPYKAAANPTQEVVNRVGRRSKRRLLSPLNDRDWGLPFQAAYEAVLERRKKITVEKIRLRILIMEVAANAEYRAAEIIGVTPNTVEGQNAVREARRWRELDISEGKQWSAGVNKSFDKIRLERIEAAKERVRVPGELQKALDKVLAQIMVFSHKCPHREESAVSPSIDVGKENLPPSNEGKEDYPRGSKSSPGKKICALASLDAVKFGRVRRPSSRLQFFKM